MPAVLSHSDLGDLPADRHLSSAPDPYSVYRRLREIGPVVQMPEVVRSAWASGTGESGKVFVVTRYDETEAALANWAVFSSGPRDPATLVVDPPEHTALRRHLRDGFTPAAVRVLRADVEARARGLLYERAAGDELDLAADYAWDLAGWAICTVVGLPMADRPELTRLYRGGEHRGDPDLKARLKDYLHGFAAERARHPRDDLPSRLTAELGSSLVAGMYTDLFGGGIDNPTSAVGNALLALAEHPAQRRVLQAVAHDLPALTAAVNECIRYDSPIQRIFRFPRRNVALGGKLIPAGSDVLLLLGSANRDERRFEDPDQLDLARPPVHNLSFGHGIHFCLGAPLTRIVMMAALPPLLERFPDYELTGPPERPRRHVERAVLSLPARLG